MTYRITFLDGTIAEYADAHSTPPDEVQQNLISVTREMGGLSIMQIGSLQGAFMTALTKALQPMFAVEIGTFTGYSAIAVAKALPVGGRLLCCDVSEEWTDVARLHWERAGVADQIELHIGPALETLRALPDEPKVDMAFVDADKAEYVDYYEELVPRLSDRGVILVDNVLWDGKVTNPRETDPHTEAIRTFNRHVVDDPRVIVALLPVGDGVSMITRA